MAVNRRGLLGIATVLVLTLASYWPALSGQFLWDDNALTANPLLRSPAGLWTIWFQPTRHLAEEHYWPLTYTLFWLQYRLWGLTPFGYHLVNVLLHAANALLVWVVLRRLKARGAWLAALLFALHPVHVESVAWIVELKDVLSGALYLTAAWCYVEWLTRGRRSLYAAALIAFALALLSKSVVVTLPVALLLVTYWLEKAISRQRLWPVAPFMVIAVAHTLFDNWLMQHYRSVELSVPVMERLFVPGRALCFYWWKLLFPVNLAAIYPRWEIAVLDPANYLCLVIALAFPAVAWIGRRKFGMAPLLCILFYYITLLPTLGFVPYKWMLHSFVADRFQYLAMIGPLALAAAYLTMGRNRVIIAGALACGLFVLTWSHAGTYRDTEHLFSNTVRVNPRAWAARFALATLWQQQGKTELAARQYSAAFWGSLQRRRDLKDENHQRAMIQKHASNPWAYYNAGLFYATAGRNAEAEQMMRKATELGPALQEPRVAHGVLLLKLGRTPEAHEEFRRAAGSTRAFSKNTVRLSAGDKPGKRVTTGQDF